MMAPRLLPVFVLSLSAGALLFGCRSQVGDVCRCPADCRGGLVCVAGNNVVEDACIAPERPAGVCLEREDASDTQNADDTASPVPHFDLGSARDLIPDDESESGATETEANTGTETADATSADSMDTTADTLEGTTASESTSDEGTEGTESSETTESGGTETGRSTSRRDRSW